MVLVSQVNFKTEVLRTDGTNGSKPTSHSKNSKINTFLTEIFYINRKRIMLSAAIQQQPACG